MTTIIHPTRLEEPCQAAIAVLASVGNQARLAALGARLADPAFTATLEYLKRRRLDGLCYLSPNEHVPNARTRLYQRAWEYQRAAIKALFGECARLGVTTLLYKGAALTERLFEGRAFCFRGDIDVLVAPDALDEIRALFTRLGYIQSELDVERGTIIPIGQAELDEYETGHYNLRPFAKLIDFPITDEERATLPEGWNEPLLITPNGAKCAVVFDVSHALDSTIAVSEMQTRSLAGNCAGIATLADEDHLWYLCCMLYLQIFSFGSRTPLSKLAEIVRFVHHCHASLDWNRVIYLVERYNTAAPLYYILSYVNQLLGPLVPASTIRRFQPGQHDLDQDFGWQLGKLYGVPEPFPDGFGFVGTRSGDTGSSP